MKVPKVACLLVCLLAACSNHEHQDTRYHKVHPQMGTTFEITLFAASEEEAEAAFRAATQTLDDLNASLSDYLADSELSLLSTSSNEGKPQKVSTELWTVLNAAQTLSRQTSGAFDVTVGPLTRLWRQTRRRGSLPNAEKLLQTRARSGYQHLTLHPQSRSAQLTTPNMRLDLGGIAKGYAVDQVIATLAECGITRALVNGGGDLRGIGHAWKVDLQDLDNENKQTLTLNDLSAATSGDLHKSITIDGREFSHLINPHTGLGLEYRRSVTVLATNCMTADALASALSILPTRDAIRLLTQNYPKCSAKILNKNSENQQLEETIIGNFHQHFSGS